MGGIVANKNPIDEALEAKAKLSAARDEHERMLVDAWKADPSTANTAAVMTQFEPVYRNHLNIHKAPMTSSTGLRGSMLNLTVDALKSYDPNRNTTFSTHLHNTLRRISRVNKQRQNVGRIAEQPASYLGKIQQAHEELADELGRPPELEEVADRMNMSLPRHRQLGARKIKQIQAMNRRDVLSSRFESDPIPVAAQREEEVVGLLRPTLSAEAAQVYDMVYPAEGKPVTSTSAIASRLGFSASKVSRLKSEIQKKYKQYK